MLVLSIKASDYQNKSIYELQELIEASDNKKLFIDDYLSYLETNDVVNSINSLHSSNELYKSYVYSRRAPWRGVPIFIKDNIDSYGLANTAGSLLMSDNLPRDDAQLVKNLKKAGFVVSRGVGNTRKGITGSYVSDDIQLAGRFAFFEYKEKGRGYLLILDRDKLPELQPADEGNYWTAQIPEDAVKQAINLQDLAK